MPDSRLRAMFYAAGIGCVLMTPISAFVVWMGWSATIASHPNWWALVALLAYVTLVVVLTYLQRRGVNLGRGLI